MSRARIAILFPLLTAASMIGPACADEERTKPWQGTRTTRDGVVHVSNPSVPVDPPEILTLHELWRLSSETDAGEVRFGAVQEAKCDLAGNFYLLDTQLKTVHVVSADGDHLRSIGRGGEGPGEVEWPLGLVLGSQERIGILDAVGQKIVFLAPDGTPAGDWRPAGFAGQRFSPLFAWLVPRGVVISCQTRVRGEDLVTQRDMVALFGDDQQLLGTAAEKSRSRRRGDPALFNEIEAESFSFLAVTLDGRIYLSPSYSDYRIDVYDSNLEQRMIIEREAEPVPRTADQMADVRASWEAHYRRVPDTVIEVAEMRRHILSLHPRRDGTLWVETSRGWAHPPAGTALAYDVYDAEGRFIRQVALEGKIDPWNDYLFLLGDRLLVVTAGFESAQGALGAAREDSGPPAADPEEAALPEVVCYELRPTR